MAAAVLGKTEVDVQEFGQDVDVPEHPVAKLMYYFHSVCTCVEANRDPTLQRYTNYRNYRSLSREEEAKLLILCVAVSPDKLIGSIFFPSNDLGGSLNEFYKLSAVKTRLVVSESILIGGQQKRVQKVMMFNELWMEIFYIDPIRSFETRHQPALPSSSTPSWPSASSSTAASSSSASRQSRSDSSSCIIS